MDKIFEISYSMIKEDDYKGIFKIIIGIFILFAPSLSIIWVYKRKIFNSLDFTKLMLLCIVMNIVILIITMMITYIFKSYKYIGYTYDSVDKIDSKIEEIDIKMKKEVNNKENLDEYENKLEEIENEIHKTIKKSDSMFSIDVILNIGYFSIMPWINYFFYYMKVKSNGKGLELRYFLISMIIIAIIYGIAHLIIALKNIRPPELRKKYIFNNLLCESILIIICIICVF